MAAPCQNACTPWADAADVVEQCPDGPCSGYEFDQDLLEAKLAIASDLLFEWSGRRFAGSCQDTARPCARYNGSVPGFRSLWGGMGGYGYAVGVSWQSSWGFCSCNRTERSGCGSIPEVTLGAFPVTGIVEVKVDGEVLDPARYRIDDNRWLVRLPDDAQGRQRPGWPCCQDMLVDDNQADTWSVTFTYGVMPPPAGVVAAVALGCELALACDPDTAGNCRLDPRTSVVTRQGVSEILLVGTDFLSNVKLAIPEVGAFLSAYNPKGIARRAAVLSPDLPRRVRRVGT